MKENFRRFKKERESKKKVYYESFNMDCAIGSRIRKMIQEDNVRIIENIMFEFQAELDKEHNIVQIEIVSAINIDDNAKQTIKDRLSDKLQKQVNVDWSVNPDIIAGLVFIVGDNIIDTSIKSKLQMIGRNIIK